MKGNHATNDSSRVRFHKIMLYLIEWMNEQDTVCY